MTPACESALRELFHRLDEDLDSLLGREELNRFQQTAESRELSQRVYEVSPMHRCVVNMCLLKWC